MARDLSISLEEEKKNQQPPSVVYVPWLTFLYFHLFCINYFTNLIRGRIVEMCSLFSMEALHWKSCTMQHVLVRKDYC